MAEKRNLEKEQFSRNDVLNMWKQIDRKLTLVTPDSEISGELNRALTPLELTPLELPDDSRYTYLGGMTANELYNIINDEEEGKMAYDGHFAKATFTEWIFTCKVKQEVANGEMRLKTSVHSLHPVDYAQEGRSLLNSILSM